MNGAFGSEQILLDPCRSSITESLVPSSVDKLEGHVFPDERPNRRLNIAAGLPIPCNAEPAARSKILLQEAPPIGDRIELCVKARLRPRQEQKR